MSSRSLTSGEIALAQSIFGNSIDYNEVLIHNEKYASGQGDNEAVTPNGEIYFPPGHHLTDFSSGTGAQKAWFIHEMVHVLQYQEGMDVIAEKIGDRILGDDVYNYDAIFHGTPFHELNIEAQAEFL